MGLDLTVFVIPQLIPNGPFKHESFMVKLRVTDLSDISFRSSGPPLTTKQYGPDPDYVGPKE